MLRPDPSDGLRARVRRIVSLSIPPLVLIALVLLGRWAAKAKTSEIAIVAAASAAPLLDDAGSLSSDAPSAPFLDASVSENGLSNATDVASGDARLAVEMLADGGIVVDLNLATEAELQRLPGIGKTRAHSILELRLRIGRFKGVDDLARIKGFGRAMLRRLRPVTRV